MSNPTCSEFGEIPAAAMTQRTLEAFYQRLRADNVQAEDVTINEYAGGLVKTAVAVGWLQGLTLADVENMEPRKVFWLYTWVDRQLRAFFTPDPNWYGLPSNAPETQDGSPRKS